ncbi:MAG: preprotein translocase subunit SecY [Kiritimatiellae bacterium]|nr:preprotein translocase subunit SecY [Kiritimatiellia bacterium]
MSTLSNIWKIKELRSRILFTLGLIFICRLVAAVPTPGVNAAAMGDIINANRSAMGGLMGMLDIFTGGALSKFSVGTLSIWPYINASIIIQLMTAIVPSLEKMAREGDVGRQKLTQVTRYLTLVLCAGQAYAIAAGIESMVSPGGVPVVAFRGFGFRLLTVIAMTSATMLVMWLGEQITERGIGNGMSVIIMVNICARLPGAIYETVLKFFPQGGQPAELNFFTLVFLLALAFFVFAGTILLTDGVRKVPVHAARGAVGGRVAGGRSTYMPLRVNYAGVMPIIFAGPILTVLGWLFSRVDAPWLGWLQRYGDNLYNGYGRPGPCFLISYALLILFFSFFWIATQFNAVRIADDMKASNSYIPGIRPGMPTAEFLDLTMTRVTVIGSVGLIIIALLPSVLRSWGGGQLPAELASFFGGTSLLIIVGVALDTMRQIESYLVMREYDGFLKHGRIRGRAG